ncbi:hypothetical protein J4227_01055 [Candidatus Woesearchaeota archaeon]|nr:hypothetical protein [Candidatus Woesearchaeota archaeon]
MALNRASKKWKASLMRSTLQNIVSQPRNLLLAFLFDLAFVFIAYILRFTILDMLASTMPVAAGWAAALHLLAIIIFYSAIKFIVLVLISEYSQKKQRQDYSRIMPFIILNAALGLILTILLLMPILVNLIPVSQGLAIFIYWAYMATALAFFYLWLNLSHSFFIIGNGAFGSLGKGLKFTLTQFRKHSGVAGLFVSAALVIAVLVLLMDLGLRLALNAETINISYPRIAMWLTYATLFIFYLLHAFCRAYFLDICLKSKA